ncbi:hypothetical protein NFI96_004119 [Prochilodus magdalenae]|nr:hypothetical protein NFI96_004119 [Prochilodus magdalenae]
MEFLYRILLIYTGFMETMSDHVKVIGPAAPLVVEVGEDLVLPCSLQPSISAKDMMVEWIRADLRESSTLVHLYKDHKDRNDNQMESYRGRTALYEAELEKGNTSLKLSAVQPSDEGVYQCAIKSEAWYDDITLQVEVIKHLKVVGPDAPLVADAGTDLVLPCSLQPKISIMDMRVEWIRLHLDDRLVHLYEGNEDRNQKQMETYRGRTALFTEELKKGNASLKLSAVQPSDEGFYQCAIESTSWYEGVTFYVNVKDKLSEQKLSSAECLVIAYMRLQSEYVRKELNLKKYNTSDEGYRRLIPSMTNCRKAQLTMCKLSTHSCGTLQSVLQTEHSSLVELDLSNNDLQDSGVELLSTTLKSSQCKLKTLRFAICNLSKKSCEILQSVLQTENSLKELDLSNNDLQDSGVELLSAGLKSSHCKLEILRLALCDLGIKTCENLGSVLQKENSTLKELDLSDNDLQDLGVVLLAVALKSSHCKLEILRLSGCMVTEEGCNSLGLALNSSHSHLKDLDLTYNHSGDSGVERLSTRLQDQHCKLRLEHGGNIRISSGLKKYSCELHLDLNTTHSDLSLSDGNRRLTNVGPSQSIGVYLDWGSGALSFYTISPNTLKPNHLHTFTTTFTEPLYAGYWVGLGSSLCV